MISSETIQKIFDTVDIQDVISDFITLRKRGVNYLGLCPFHDEKTPSFSVSPSKGIYKCFGCGKAGNAVNFVMEHEKLNYAETLRYLAKKYHIEVIEKALTTEEKLLKDKRESLLIVQSFANDFFQKTLHNTTIGKNIALSYLKERSFQSEVIKKFEIGYNADEESSLSKAAIKNGYQKEYLIQSGLSLASGSGLKDRFQGRLIFPIHSLSGKVVGFGGRILKSNTKAAKYINSPESEVYNKSRLLYGLYFAKDSIRKNNECFLVEGYTDVLALHQQGVENVVASSGTSLTAFQILQIKRITNNISLIFDGDKAGIKATFRNIDLILENDINLSVVPLPEGEDPDSFARKTNASELNDFLQQQKQNFILYKASFIYQDTLNHPEKKSKAIMDIVRTIAAVSNQITRAEYIKKCSQIFDINEKTLYAELSRILLSKKKERKKRRPSASTPPKELHKSINPCDKVEKELLRCLLIYGNNSLLINEKDNISINVASYIFEELDRDGIKAEDEIHQLILDEYKANFSRDDFNALQYFTHHGNAKVSNQTAHILAEPYQLSDIWKKETPTEETLKQLPTLIPQFLYAYKQKKLQLIQNDLHKKLIQAKEKGDEELIQELIKEKIWLDKTKAQIAKILGNRTIL